MAVVHNLHMQVPILIAHIRSNLLNDMIDNIQFGSRPFGLICHLLSGHNLVCINSFFCIVQRFYQCDFKIKILRTAVPLI